MAIRKSRIPPAIARASALGCGVLWTLLIAYPLAMLLRRVSGAQWDGVYFSIAWVTFKQAAISTLLSGAIGLPLGLLCGAIFRSKKTGFGAGLGSSLRFLLSIPFGVPTVVAATAWVAVLGRHGWLVKMGFQPEILYSLSAVILAHVFFNAPWVAWWVGESSAQIPSCRLDAARSLGAGPIDVFFSIQLPAVALALGSALVQVFALCTMSFALVLILGGGPPVQTLEVAIYSRIRMGELDVTGAVMCGCLELILTLIPWLLLTFLPKFEEVRLDSRRRRISLGSTLLAVAIALIFVVPYLAVFDPSTLNYFGRADFWEEFRRPAWVSLQIALGSAMLALGWAVAGSVAAFKREKLISLLLGVPTGISVLVLGLGFWLAYSRWVDPFSGSLSAIVAIQGTLFVPLAFRLLWPQVKSAQSILLDSAQALGASPVSAFFHIEWPRLKSTVVGIFAMVFGASLGEVAAVSLFYSEKQIPLPLLISRAMAQYQFEKASAVGALLLVLASGSFFIAAYLTDFSGMKHERS